MKHSCSLIAAFVLFLSLASCNDSGAPAGGDGAGGQTGAGGGAGPGGGSTLDTLLGSGEKTFVTIASDIVTKLAQRDSIGLTHYIRPGTGVTLTYALGVTRRFKRLPALSFSRDEYPASPFYDGVRFSNLEYGGLPAFDCGSMKWSREGTFADSTGRDSVLSGLAVDLNRFFDGNIPADSIGQLRKLELVSRKIVIASNDSESLIFYLSLIDDKWWLTVIDKSTTDCSA